MATQERVRVQMRRSQIGGTERQRETLRGLGFRRIGDVRVLPKTPAILGMLKKVEHLVQVDNET